MSKRLMNEDWLLRDTRRTTGHQAKRQTLKQGVRTALRLGKQAEIRRLRGKLRWQGDLNSLRSDG
jgi:hypothetical protein